jgi:hypothetical protein
MLNLYKYYDKSNDLVSYKTFNESIDLLNPRNISYWRDTPPEKFDSIKHIIIKTPKLIWNYIRYVSHTRWPEAEPVLAGTIYALYYVNKILGGSWDKFDNGKYDTSNRWFDQNFMIIFHDVLSNMNNEFPHEDKLIIKPKLVTDRIGFYDNFNDLVGIGVRLGTQITLKTYLKTHRQRQFIVNDYRKTDDLYDKLYDFLTQLS